MQGAAGAPPVVTTPPPPAPTPGGTAARPVLTDADAANFEILDYLRQTGAVAAPITDNWDPTAGVTLPASPTVVVAPGQSINAAIAAATGASRIFIQVMPGTYRETVSAILRDFKRQGLVELGYRRISLVDAETLRDIAGIWE